MGQRSPIGRRCLSVGLCILLTLGSQTSIATAKSEKWNGYDGAWVAQLVFRDWWKTVSEQQKQDVLTHPRNSAAALCMDWRSLRVVEGESAFHFLQWRAEWDATSTETAAAEVMASCEAWKNVRAKIARARSSPGISASTRSHAWHGPDRL